MANKKRTTAQVLDDAETNRLETLAELGTNRDKVRNPIEYRTGYNYDRMLYFGISI